MEKYANGQGALGSVSDNVTERKDYTKIKFELNPVKDEDKEGKQPCYGLVRVSTEGQAEEDKYGIDRQKEEILKHSEAEDFYVAAWFIDAESGDTYMEDRPACKMMMASVEESEGKRGVRVGNVFLETQDRMARKYRVQQDFMDQTEKLKLDVWSAKARENISEALRDNPTRKLMIDILGVISEYEKNRGLERQGAGQRKKIEKDGGHWVKRFGRDLKKKDDKKKEAKRLGEIECLAFMERKRAQGLTYKQVAEETNKEGFTTRYGKPWTLYGVRVTLDDEAWEKNIKAIGKAETEREEVKKTKHLSRYDELKEKIKKEEEARKNSENRNDELLMIILRERLANLKLMEKPQDEVRENDEYGVTTREHKILTRMINLKIDDDLTAYQITDYLREKNILNRHGEPWDYGAVHRLLIPKVGDKYFHVEWDRKLKEDTTPKFRENVGIAGTKGHRRRWDLCERCGKEPHEGDCKETYERSDMRDNWEEKKAERIQKRAEARKKTGKGA